MISTLALVKFALAGHKKADVSVTSKGEPTYTCPNGFDLQGKKCVRNREEALMPVCEQGILRQDAKSPICLLSAAPREVCPEGYVEDGLVCALWETRAPVTSCPGGYSLVSDKKKDIYCEKTVTVAGPLVCPQGTVDDGKNCIQYNYISPMWACPAGTSQEGKFCASFEEYNCSEPNFPSSKKHHLRMLKPKKSDVVIELGKGHVETIVEVERTCRRTNYSPAVAECPPGSFSEGKQCKVVETFARQPTNPIMTFDSADVLSTCPAGFSWCPDSKKHGFGGGKKGDMCCSVQEAQPFWECDSGFTLEGGRCVSYQQPVYICNKTGYKKNSKKNSCSLQEYREPLVTYKVAYTCEGKDCGGHGH